VSSSSARQAVLELSDLSVHLVTGEAVLEGVDLRLGAGEILGIVGESGSGKTTAALSLFGYSTPGTRITGGELGPRSPMCRRIPAVP
jgi:peptide/nickel transport system ATP-binding protein